MNELNDLLTKALMSGKHIPQLYRIAVEWLGNHGGGWQDSADLNCAANKAVIGFLRTLEKDQLDTLD